MASLLPGCENSRGLELRLFLFLTTWRCDERRTQSGHTATDGRTVLVVRIHAMPVAHDGPEDVNLRIL